MRQYLLIFFLVIALPGTGNAAETDKWQFTISPYLWVASIVGSTGADGIDSGIDTGYNFLSLDNLEGAFFVAASARKGRWTIQTDAVFLKFADEGIFDLLTANIDLSGSVLELSGAYRPGSFEYTELIFGVRQVSLEIDIGLTPGPQGIQKENWLDPLIGIRHIRPLGERWRAIFRADLGGFGVSSELTFNGLVGADFNMTEHSSLFMGYRYLTLDFEEGGFLADLTADGFVLGVEFSF
jgi:opacity protein-like surface antigen